MSHAPHPAGVAVTVRHAGPRDADAVAGVLCRALKAAYLGTAPGQAPESSPEQREQRERLTALEPAELVEGARSVLHRADSRECTVVAELDGEVAGLERLRIQPARHDDSEGEIVSLYVDPPAWGAGVGGRLLDHGLAELGERACRRAWLWVAAENDRARRFYRRYGFAPDGARRTYRFEVWGVDLGFALPVVRYARELPVPPAPLEGPPASLETPPVSLESPPASARTTAERTTSSP